MNNPQRPTDAGCVEPLGYQCLLSNGEWSVVIYPHADALAAVLNPNTLVSAMRPVFAAPTASGGDAAELAAADMREAVALLRGFPSNTGDVEGRITEKGSATLDAIAGMIEAAAIRALPLAKQEQS